MTASSTTVYYIYVVGREIGALVLGASLQCTQVCRWTWVDFAD